MNSSVFVLLGILAIAFFIVYKFGKWSQIFIHHDQKIDDLSGLSEKVIKIETKVDLIYQQVNVNSPIRAHSPISLTDIGNQIISNLKGQDLFSKYAEKLVKEVELTAPKNAYDIQEASMKVAKEKMLNFVNADELTAIKQEAFSRGLLLEDVMGVFGVLLRDHLLKSKNLPIADVDKHTKKDA